jgi:hypothetical protein
LILKEQSNVARIPTYRARRGIDSDRGGMPRPRIDQGPARGLAAVSGALSVLGDRLERHKEHNRRLEDQRALVAFEDEQKQGAQARLQELPASGEGYTAATLEEFDAGANKMRAGVSDRDTTNMENSLVDMRVRLAKTASNVEARARKDNATDQTNQMVDGFLVQTADDPDDYERLRVAGHEALAAGLTNWEERKQGDRAFAQKALAARIEGLVTQGRFDDALEVLADNGSPEQFEALRGKGRLSFSGGKRGTGLDRDTVDSLKTVSGMVGQPLKITSRRHRCAVTDHRGWRRDVRCSAPEGCGGGRAGWLSR